MITNDLEELSAMIKFNLNLQVAMVPGTIDFLRTKMPEPVKCTLNLTHK